MAAVLTAHRRFRAEERLAAGAGLGRSRRHRRHPRRTAGVARQVRPDIDRLVKAAGVPRLTSHGLRHTAATHMVKHASDIGEIRAAADILGHSPDMLMRTYAHALPESVRAVTDKIQQRATGGTAR